jgi:16S rRNA (cytidine1402-2'-O)-methyltransferase
LRAISATLIFYEAPHRIAAALKDARAVLGNRQAVVARELTKLHEEIARGRLDALATRFSGGARGEIVLLISGANETDSPASNNPEDPARRLTARVSELEREGMDAKSALKKAARELGLKRAEAYRLMVAQKTDQE